MMDNYKEIVFGSEGITYLQKWLERGGKTLAKALLQAQPLERGRVAAMLPTYVSDEKALQFEGGVLKEPPPETHYIETDPSGKRWRWVRKPTTEPCLVEIIQGYLKADEGRICVFEDYLARPSDPVPPSRRDHMVTFKEECYQIVTWKDSTAEKIKATIREAKAGWPPLIGAMTSVPKEYDLALEAGKEIAIADIRLFAERAEKLIIGAYDGEGYLVWSRR